MEVEEVEEVQVFPEASEKNQNCQTMKIGYWYHLSWFSFDDWLLTEKTCDNGQLLANFITELITSEVKF